MNAYAQDRLHAVESKGVATPCRTVNIALFRTGARTLDNPCPFYDLRFDKAGELIRLAYIA